MRRSAACFHVSDFANSKDQRAKQSMAAFASIYWISYDKDLEACRILEEIFICRRGD